MAIGTSLGAFFDDEFQHQAGVPVLPKAKDGVIKPNDTGDDSVLPPSEGTYDQPKPMEVGFKEAADKLFGLNGVERYKLWPERMLQDLNDTAGDVSAGKIPMWSMTPDGEFHTSLEGLEAAHKLMPAANSLPVTVQLRGAGLKALETYHEAPYETTANDQFQSLLRQVRRQPSNTVEGEVIPPGHEVNPFYDSRFPAQNARMGIPPTRPIDMGSQATPSRYTPEFLRGQHPDQMSDSDFLTYGEYQQSNTMTPAQEARWNRLNDAEAEHYAQEGRFRGESYNQFEQEPYRYDVDAGPAPKDIDYVPQHLREGVEQAQTQKEMKLFKAGTAGYGEGQKFVFANKDGIGEMRLSERRNGKDLYVNWIGTVNHHTYEGDAGTFGGMKMKEVIRQLMDMYPKAETISGFRVSGVRGRTGANNASIRLPGRGKAEPKRKTIDELNDEWEQ